ncbi:MAG TPA: DUF1801 domain-containing protein [Ignavibacteria bacterium]|nr:DUF1801 domain-containing protein [Ignavibacteria bacterium]HMR39905.1 DUF1801 domain-containing protein [Ignavibacteria bacterium]
MITKTKGIDDFPNKIIESGKADMSGLRKIILRILPKAKKIMMYGMPAYEVEVEVEEKALAAINSQKNYMFLYACTEAIKYNKELLKGLSCGRSFIRFKSPDRLPELTIVNILKDTDCICRIIY